MLCFGKIKLNICPLLYVDKFMIPKTLPTNVILFKRTHEERDLFYAKYVPAFLMAFAVGVFTNTMYWNAPQKLKMDFISITTLGVYTTFLCSGLSMTMGHISDSVGRKPLRFLGCIFLMTASIAAPFADKVWQLYILML